MLPQFIIFPDTDCPILLLVSKLSKEVFSDADRLVKSELPIEV